MRESHFKNSERNYGGGYDEVGNSESGALTVTARVSNGASRYAMPSMPELVYAALLYKDGNSIENPASTNFVQGTATENAGETKLNFSFQKPDDTDGTFTLEIFAFAKTSDEETPQFSKETALLSGNKTGLSIVEDTIEINGTIALAISSTDPGTVSLKIKVPEGCSLYISETNEDGALIAENESHFTVTGTSPDFTLTQISGGISAGAYQVKFTVKKGDEIVHIFSEYINVINGLCTDTWWNGAESSAVKNVANSIAKTVYVRGTGGWYDKTGPYKNSATASDSNSGSFLSPLATIQKAVDAVIARNDGTSNYTIYVDGTLDGMTAAYLGADGMADFSKLTKNLTLTIKALSETKKATPTEKDTLDAGARFTIKDDGTVAVTNAGIGKRVIKARPAGGILNLTLENLVITGGNTATYGGGIDFVSAGGSLTMTGCAVRGNEAGYGGGVYGNGGTVTMEGSTISGNTATTSGGGVFINGNAFTMESSTISGNTANTNGGGICVKGSTFTMEDGTISDNTATEYYGGGVHIESGTFTMSGGTMSGNTANINGGGVYVIGGTFAMSGGTISKNIANSDGGGIFNASTFTMTGGAIEDNEAEYGGGVLVSGGTFTMSGGTTKISGNTAKSNGGGVFVYNGGEFTMGGGTVSDNTANSDGGGVYNASTVKMTGGTIENNEADSGGGVLINGGTFTMSGGTAKISNNTAKSNGGGVFVYNGGEFTMTGGTIGGETADEGNKSGTLGAGVCVGGGTFEMSGTAKISGNTTSSSGGGVFVNTGGTFTMTSGEISRNTADNAGGVFVRGGGKFTMTGGGVSDNKSDRLGGGVYNSGTFEMSGTAKITGNKAGTSGGGVFVLEGGEFTMTNGEIRSNSTETYGGGVFVYPNGAFTMSGGTISGNTATINGGGVFNNSGTFTHTGGSVQSD